MDRLAKAELALDLSAPFLGFAAVAWAAPDWLPALAATGWLIVVLDGYIATFISRSGTRQERALRFAGPAIVLLGQLLRDAPGLADWAIQSAACGMGARGLALTAVMIEKAAAEHGAGSDDYRAALPGMFFIASFSAVTLGALASAWRALHTGFVDEVTLASGATTSFLADIRRIRELGPGDPEAREIGEVLIAPLLLAWFVQSCALLWATAH